MNYKQKHLKLSWLNYSNLTARKLYLEMVKLAEGVESLLYSQVLSKKFKGRTPQKARAHPRAGIVYTRGEK